MQLTKTQKINRSKILDKIYAKGPISRIDIATETGLTPATVTTLTGSFLEEGLIAEIGEDSEMVGSGRRKILLDIQPNFSFFIGLELSEKFVTFCLMDNTGIIIEDKVIHIKTEERETLLSTDNIIKELKQFKEEVNSYEITAVGVALPGHYHTSDQVLLTNNPIWKSFDLKKLSDAVSVPMHFENNVKSMLYFERFFEKNFDDVSFVFFHVSRGIYSAHMYEGELYADKNNLVGEVGHTTIQVNGELCECGNKGCLQTFASENWMIRHGQIIFDHVQSSYLRQLVTNRNQITMDTLRTAYKLGDVLITDIFENAIQAISTSIINLTMTNDARIIYVHGSIFSEETLVDQLNAHISQRKPLFENEPNPRIQVIPYREINGAVGACSLCVAETYTKF